MRTIWYAALRLFGAGRLPNAVLRRGAAGTGGARRVSGGRRMLFRSDVYEDDGELVIEIEAPGVPAEKLAVSVGEGVLVIEAALPRRADVRQWHRRERASGAFRRELPLPAHVVPSLADAYLRDGLLRIRLPLARRREAERVTLELEREQGLGARS
jgi:HSP20 family molecular chaperone IbpA